jgi:solute carrier family 24 (sodium/potassium/calcium exchanger), member 6
LSNYDGTPDERDGWGIDSGDLEHDRPIHLHGRNGLLSSPEPTQRHIEQVLSPETQYRMVEDGMNRVCTGQSGAMISTNWSGAWHDGIQEFKQHFITMWEDFMTDGDLKLYEKILLILEFPFVAARTMSIPIPCEGYYCRGILAVSVLLSPLWFGYYLNVGHDINLFWSGGFPWVLILLLISSCCGAMVLRYAPVGDGAMNLAFATPIALFGFFMAATWIDYIADHLVSLLDFLGIICNIPSSIMGLTVLAWGNSMGDLSANMTMARKGLANMAMTACFAGPVFNMLIGLALGFSALSAQTGVLDHTVVLNPSIITGFVAIIIHTVSLIVIGTFCFKARIPKEYGYGAIGLYMTYVTTSFLLQFGSSRHH